MADTKILGTGGFDPNAGIAPQHGLQVVIKGQQDLQNKHLKPGELGKTIDDLHRAALNIQAQVDRMPAITNDEIYAKAGALLATVKNLLKQSDLERKAVTNPILALKKAVDAAFETGSDGDLHKVKIHIEGAMVTYAQEKRAKAQAEAAAAAQAAREAAAQAQAAKDADAAKVLTEMAEQAEAPAPQAVVQSHGVKTQLRTRKHVNVIDLRVALAYLAKNAVAAELPGLVTINSRALFSFLSRVEGVLESDTKIPGFEIVETDSITNF